MSEAQTAGFIDFEFGELEAPGAKVHGQECFGFQHGLSTLASIRRWFTLTNTEAASGGYPKYTHRSNRKKISGRSRMSFEVRTPL